MDTQKLRQEFEKLPDIKGILYGSDFGFNESLNEYYHPDHTNHRLNYAFIMGAWMAWKAKAQAVPEGFVLVPREPTEEMLGAAWEAPPVGGPSTNRRIFHEKQTVVYKAMVDEAEKAMIEAQEQSHEH